MPKFQFTNKAIDDLTDIWNYTLVNWSENQADKYYIEIINKCKEISENHLDGKPYDSIYESLKGSKINKHIIFYREIDENLIEIERILHQKMDLRNRLKSKFL